MDFDVAPRGARRDPRRGRPGRLRLPRRRPRRADHGLRGVSRARVRLDRAARTRLPGRRRAHRHLHRARRVRRRRARAVVVPTPAYPPFFEVVELTGRPVVAAPMVRDGRRDTLDLDAIDAALACRRARGPALQSAQSDRPGVHDDGARRRWPSIVDRHGARVVADEVHAPLVYARQSCTCRTRPCRTRRPRTRSRSPRRRRRSTSPGLKCAQVVASNHADAARWRELRVFEVAGPTPIGIAASVAAYRDARRLAATISSRTSTATAAASASSSPRTLPASRTGRRKRRSSRGSTARRSVSTTRARFFLDHARVALSDGPPFGPGCEQHVRLNFATSSALLERIVAAWVTQQGHGIA